MAEVVQRLKGRTSQVIRKKYPELEEFLWGDNFGADGHFAETVGNVDEEVVRRYIREQRRQLCQIISADLKPRALAQGVGSF